MFRLLAITGRFSVSTVEDAFFPFVFEYLILMDCWSSLFLASFLLLFESKDSCYT